MAPIENRKVIQQICYAILKNQTFILSGHKKPDGDTVASELAMASLLRRLKKKVEIVNAEPVPKFLSFLPNIKKIKTSKKVNKNYDVAIIFECSGPERMGNILDLKNQVKTVINIDHHLKYSLFGDINLIGLRSSSNSEQLTYIFDWLQVPINTREATYLYLGIMTDTGRFQFSNTNAETLSISSKLLEKGVQPAYLSEKVYGTKTFSSIQLLARALSKMKLVHHSKIAVLHSTHKDYQQTQSNEEETEDIVNHGLFVPTTLISIFCRETEQKGIIKVSLRSRRGINVCHLAEQFGGGGHKYASGCEVRGTLQTVLSQLVQAASLLL